MAQKREGPIVESPGIGDLSAAIAISLIVQTTISLNIASVPVLAPALAAARNWNIGLIAFYAPLLCVSGLISSFTVPKLLQILGGMGLSLWCLAATAIGLLCLLLPSPLLVAAAPLIIGFGYGAMNSASSQILGPRSSPRTAGLVMSIKQTGVPLGGVAAGFVVPLIALHFAWHFAVLQLVLGSLALLVLCLPTIGWLNGPKVITAPSRFRPLGPLKQLLAIPRMNTLLIASMAFVAMQACLRSFFTAYLVDGLGFDLATAGLAFGVSQVGGIVGQIAWASASDRLLSTHAVMSIIGVLMTAAAVLTAALTHQSSIYLILAVAMIYGVSAAGFIPVILGEVARRAPRDRVGDLTSGANLFLIAGVLTGPLLFGAVASRAGYPSAFIVLATCTVAASILVAVSPPARSRDIPA
jgi:MFS family permease